MNNSQKILKNISQISRKGIIRDGSGTKKIFINSRSGFCVSWSSFLEVEAPYWKKGNPQNLDNSHNTMS